MSAITKALSAAIDSRGSRKRRLYHPQVEDSKAVDFASNDYLSLSQEPSFKARFLEQLQRSPSVSGSGGSAVLVTSAAHSSLESRLATVFRAPTALLTPSGFAANTSVFGSVPQSGDIIVYDEYVHASIHDGMRQSRATGLIPFAHNSITAFEKVLRSLVEENEDAMSGIISVFIAVEGVYSMDGTVAPLNDIVRATKEILKAGNGLIVVDEAHSVGIYGPNGTGLVTMNGLEKECLIRVVTFGKALAGQGAVILTTDLIKDYIINYARPFIFTTSMSIPNVISMGCTIDLLEDGTAARQSSRLMKNCSYLLDRLTRKLEAIPPDILRLPDNLSAKTSAFRTAIIPLLTAEAISLRQFLLREGVNTSAVFFPIVPRTLTRIRISIHANNTVDEMDRLVTTIYKWAEAQVTSSKQTQRAIAML